MTTTTEAAEARHIKLWDAPTRFVHWALVVAVSTAIVTAQIGGEWMELHGQAGLAILGLLVFRGVWGFVGSTHSRFASFWPSVAKLRAYLRGQWRGIGHNPLGALAVFALLGLLLAQAATGLFSNDDIAYTGPWAAHVSDELSQTLTGWHHRLSNVLYGLLGLHVAAIAVYVLVKKQGLLRPMITGRKRVDADTPAPRPAGALAWVAALVVAAVVVSAVGQPDAVVRTVGPWASMALSWWPIEARAGVTAPPAPAASTQPPAASQPTPPLSLPPTKPAW